VSIHLTTRQPLGDPGVSHVPLGCDILSMESYKSPEGVWCGN
jgi:hypothetical protein